MRKNARLNRAIDLTVERLDKLLAEVKPEDLLILTMGFFAGTQGYTPLSAIMKLSGNSTVDVDRIKDERLQDSARMWNSTMIGAGGLFQMFFGPVVADTLYDADAAKAGETADQRKARQDALMKTLALGCIGSIEAFAVTRPGTVQGIGEIVKGIGEIVPL